MFESEVKLFHGYILTAIDGSDFEISNNKKQEKNLMNYIQMKVLQEQLYQICMMF